jgi:hypothetical protein
VSGDPEQAKLRVGTTPVILRCGKACCLVATIIPGRSKKLSGGPEEKRLGTTTEYLTKKRSTLYTRLGNLLKFACNKSHLNKKSLLGKEGR